MEDEFRQSMFERARDQFDSAARWSFVAVAVLGAFHLLTFGPYLDLDSALRATGAELAATRATVESLEVIVQEFEELETVILPFLEQELDGLLVNLRRDFDDLSMFLFGDEVADLDTALDALAVPVTDTASAQDPASRRAQMPQVQEQLPLQVQRRMPQVQAQMSPSPLGARFEIEPAQIVAIRRAGDTERRRELVAPVVLEKIIEPRFARAEGAWRRHLEQQVSERLVSIERELEALGELSMADADVLRDIRSATTDTIQAIRSFDVSPPEDPEWWSTVEGKQMVMLRIRGRAERSIKRHEDLERIAQSLARMEEERRQAVAELREEIATLEQTFDAQKEQLAQSNRLFLVIPADLDSIVDRFPLILGAVFFALWAWQARRVRDLRAAIDFVDTAGARSELHDWLSKRLAGVVGRGIASDSSKVLAVWAWIAVAAHQLIASGRLNLEDVLPLALVAAAAAGVGRLLCRSALA